MKFKLSSLFLSFAVVAIFLVSLLILRPFVTALLWSSTLAVLTYPWYQKFRSQYQQRAGRIRNGKLRDLFENGDNLAALKTTIWVAVIFLLPLIIVGSIAELQIAKFFDSYGGTDLMLTLERLDTSLRDTYQTVGLKDFELKSWWIENGQSLLQQSRTPAIQFAKGFGNGIFNAVVTILTLFFLLRDGHLLRDAVRELSGLTSDRFQSILSRVGSTVHAVFRGTVIVAMIQGAVMGLTYAVLGVPNALLLGLFSILLCIVPLLGAPVVYIPVALLFVLQGEVGKAAVVLAVGFLIVSQIDNVLKPFLIGNQVSLHPMGIFFFALGGIALVGPIGLMVGPVVLAITLEFIEILRQIIAEQNAKLESGQRIEN